MKPHVRPQAGTSPPSGQVAWPGRLRGVGLWLPG